MPFRNPRHPSQRFDFLVGHRVDRGALTRRVRLVALVAGGLLVVLALAIVPSALTTVASARAAKIEFARGQRALAGQDFGRARAAFRAAGDDLTAAEDAYRPIRFWGRFPALGPNVRAGSELLAIGQVGVRAAQRVTDFADLLLTPLAARGADLTYGALTVTDRTDLLTRLSESESTLAALDTDVEEIVRRWDGLPNSLLTRRVRRDVEPVRDSLVLATEALERAAPIARVLPKLLGHGSATTYLFLLQNNAELRPSGGFIGTYGLLKVRDGSITSFATDNSYALDDRVKKTLRIPAPAPLQRYNDTRHWFFRDSNWSPDFQAAADTAADFYHREGGGERLDGVLGVTPTFVSGLLRLTGPITVDGIAFTADNLVDTLQEEVTFGFAQRGVGLTARKGIIGRMGQTLTDRLFALPQRQWGELWRVLFTALNEKQLQLAFADRALQSFAEEQGWAGRVLAPDHDSLLIVDANLASLKTDPVIERTARYAFDATGDVPRATLTVTYANHGAFTKKTTRYRTYVRVYVPRGAQLTGSEGADLTDRSDRPGNVDVSEELDRTVFGAFKSIEPGQTESLTFHYTLPASVSAELAAGTYTLTVQKQAGTIAPAVDIAAAFRSPARLTAGLDRPSGARHTRHELATDRRVDRTFRFRVSD